MKRFFLPLLLFSLVLSTSAFSEDTDPPEKPQPAWKNPDLPLEDRIQDMIGRMTLDEKISQLLYNSPAIERLDIPAYNWWNECLHGVARAGRATVFPQAIGLAATFDEDLMHRVSTAISDEARAMYNAAVARDRRWQYGGLTFWTPNINIFRDPRWGRGQETYGEDPYLTAQLGVAFVKGLQGDDPVYLKTAACAKHYAVHSGPEAQRHTFNAEVSEKDLRETYLPAFKSLVDAGVEAVMCAYNRTNGEPCCGSPLLLKDILRKEWGFEGHVLSDCWALDDFHLRHKVVEQDYESAAMAINSGVDLNCGWVFKKLKEAVDKGLVTEQTIDGALAQLLRTRFRLGMFDPPARVPWSNLSPGIIDCDQHRKLAREAACKSIVMLKNKNNVLPLRKDAGSFYVIGPTAMTQRVLVGNYFGLSSRMVTLLEGVVGRLERGSFIEYHEGCLMFRENVNGAGAFAIPRRNQAIIAMMGVSNLIEGEEGETLATKDRGDRTSIGLPPHQVKFLKELREKNEDIPLVVVLTGGTPLAIPEVHELADAILFAWYPGEEGGTALADILFGDVSPSGRLPVTFPKSIKQLPPYEDYSLEGRTYRYMKEEPLYPFGFGLSYTQFEYSDLTLSSEKLEAGKPLDVTVCVTNKGKVASDDVLQLYISKEDGGPSDPRWSLNGFARVHLRPSETQVVKFSLLPEQMGLWSEEGILRVEPGTYTIRVGGSSPGPRSEQLGAAKPAEKSVTITGAGPVTL